MVLLAIIETIMWFLMRQPLRRHHLQEDRPEHQGTSAAHTTECGRKTIFRSGVGSHNRTTVRLGDWTPRWPTAARPTAPYELTLVDWLISDISETGRASAAADQLCLALAKAIEQRTQREEHELAFAEKPLDIVDGAIGTVIDHLSCVPGQFNRGIAMRMIIKPKIDRVRTLAANKSRRQAQTLATNGITNPPKRAYELPPTYPKTLSYAARF